jgi:hypothetical protein
MRVKDLERKKEKRECVEREGKKKERERETYERIKDRDVE